MRLPLLLLSLCGATLQAPPLLFPHGYFDSNKLQPFDAIYLNLMAQSNLEYGGTTDEELAAIIKEKNPPRTTPAPSGNGGVSNRRIGPGLLSPDAFEAEGLEELGGTGAAKTPVGFTFVGPEAGRGEGDSKTVKHRGEQPDRPKSPFRRAMKDSPLDEEEEENPFTDIATRAPPRGRRGRRGRKHRPRHRARHHHRHEEDEEEEDISLEISPRPKPKKHRERDFLTRESIVKSKKRMEEERRVADEREEDGAFTRTHPREEEEDEDMPLLRPSHNANHGHARPEEDLPRRPPHSHHSKIEEAEEEHRRPLEEERQPPNNFPRLPNNPFSKIGIEKPTILRLPIPPFARAHSLH